MTPQKCRLCAFVVEVPIRKDGTPWRIQQWAAWAGDKMEHHWRRVHPTEAREWRAARRHARRHIAEAEYTAQQIATGRPPRRRQGRET